MAQRTQFARQIDAADEVWGYRAGDPASDFPAAAPNAVTTGFGANYSRVGGPKPSRQTFNWTFRTIFANLRDVNAFGASLPYDAALSYESAAVVTHDDKLWIALQAATGIEPGTAEAYWHEIRSAAGLQLDDVGGTLSLAKGGTGASTASAARTALGAAAADHVHAGTTLQVAIGGVVFWPVGDAPNGWHICNGQALMRSMYSDLFNAIGTRFGAGDRSTTFNLPNYEGVMLVGKRASDSIGATGGARTVTLSSSQMPMHSHSGGSHSHRVADQYNPADRIVRLVSAVTGTVSPIRVTVSSVSVPSGLTTTQRTTTSASASTGSAGSSGSHDNMPPYSVGHWIMRTS